MKVKLATGLLLICVFFVLASCAGQSRELLGENYDYKKMNDEQLLEYFFRLNDEIEKQEKQTGPSVGFGIGGFGFGRGHSGIGGGVGVEAGSTGYIAEDLRQRRIEVHMEMKRRNINP